MSDIQSEPGFVNLLTVYLEVYAELRRGVHISAPPGEAATRHVSQRALQDDQEREALPRLRPRDELYKNTG